MPLDTQSRQFVNVGMLLQGAIVVGVGVYAMAVALYWLFTN